MQRVAIASILVMQPEVMILDEPTSQLDPEGTEEVFRVVEQLSGTGKTIIMVEQKLEKMAKYCDRLILMHDGKVVDFDTPGRRFLQWVIWVKWVSSHRLLCESASRWD